MNRISCTLLLILGVVILDITLGGVTHSSKSPLETFKKTFTPGENGARNQMTWNQFQEKVQSYRKKHTKKIEKADDRPFITWDDSIVYGKTMVTIYNRTVYAFEGFRYGEPITNLTRFKPPIMVDQHWEDEYNATHIGFKCPQRAMIGGGSSGEEDCLVLNVYTPYLPGDSRIDSGLPVMFFIHGGSFTSGDSSMYLPTKLLDRDVILVVIHYRLGAHGFFTLNNDDAPGNAALYDMVAALRWTNRNIEKFGGDNEKVTIFGESAGSVSVNYMMLVEPARGLFRGVIAESGSCLDFWALDEDPTYAAHYLAEYVGCLDEDDEVIFECMANVDSYDLLSAERSLVSSDRHNGEMGFRGAAPTIQDFVSDDEDFEYIVTKHARDYLMQRDFSMVPFMTGSNKQEGSFVLAVMYHDYLLHNNLEKNSSYLRSQMVQDVLYAVGVQDDTYGLARSLQDEYCPGVDFGELTDEVFACMIDMVGVMFLKAGSWRTAAMHSYYSGLPTWYYSFELESDDSLAAIIIGDVPFDTGVTHSDEMLYIFSMPAVMDMDGQELTMNRMVEMWTNFAIYQNPTPDERWKELENLGIPTWEEDEYDDPHFMIIDKEMQLQKEYSERWKITFNELEGLDPTAEPEKCSECEDYKDQRDAFEITMIVFIVSSFFLCIIAVYFFFKARR